MLTIRPILKIQPKAQKKYFNVLKSTFVYQWGLENDKSRTNCEEITLGPFSTNTDHSKLTWELIYKYGRENKQESTMALKLLNCESSNEIEIQAICELGVADDMKTCISEKWVQDDPRAEKILKNKQKIPDYSDAALVLDLMIIILFKGKIICSHKVLDDMSKLIKSGQGDIVFVLGNEEIKAHESILTIRNETFAKMFQSDMVEKTSKRVEIKEMDVTVFKELLHYIYTEKEPTIEKKKLKDLLLAAEKYGVDDLKTWCYQEIVKTINDDNITDIYILADLVNMEVLKDKVIQFVFENNVKINEVNGYKNMRASYFQLVEEMYLKITKKQTQETSKLKLNKKRFSFFFR